MFVPIATPLICLKWLPANEKQFSVKTSSARRSSVSELGSLIVRWSKKKPKCLKTFIIGNDDEDKLIFAMGISSLYTEIFIFPVVNQACTLYKPRKADKFKTSKMTSLDFWGKKTCVKQIENFHCKRFYFWQNEWMKGDKYKICCVYTACGCWYCISCCIQCNTIQYNTILFYCENTLSYNNGVPTQTKSKIGVFESTSDNLQVFHKHTHTL